MLANDNFVIASPVYDAGNIANAGSVMLTHGTTGAQLGATLTGDGAEDQLSQNGITALSNSNFIIASSEDDMGNTIDAGSVRLVDGNTGLEIDLIP